MHTDTLRARSLINARANGVARYIQLATLFRKHVVSGHWASNQQIPTVEELSSEHDVARATVRQALGILEAEGLIARFRGRGTFVTHHVQEQIWYEVATDYSGLLRSREGAVIEVLSEEWGQQPPTLLNTIGQRAESYRHLQRRHWRNDQPVLIADVYIEETLCKRVSRKALRKQSSLSLLAGISGLEIGDIRQTLTIGSADVVTADKLHIALNSPVCYIHRSAADRGGRLILVSDGIYRGDVVRVDMKLK